MTPLGADLARRIAQTGPITFADYMAECLTHPQHGYYMGRDPLGRDGDFTTAPEISQMFGELIGLCLAQTWLDQGAPAAFTLAELGPGRGTLMADALRSAAGVPGFCEAMRLHLIEASPRLRREQAKRLAPYTPVWCDDARELETASLPLFAVANEFFDALPVRQFVRADAGWSERMVGTGDDGALAFGLSPAVPLSQLDHRLDDTALGQLIETCPAGEAVAATLGRMIAAQGGAALIIDYGGWRSGGDTLQAMRDHAYSDPLETPGEADLTAHVDFEALARASGGEGAAHTTMAPQGVFLERLGITQRARTLAQGLADQALESHIAAHRRLTHPEEMGNLFKAMALHPKDTAPPPGLEL